MAISRYRQVEAFEGKFPYKLDKKTKKKKSLIFYQKMFLNSKATFGDLLIEKIAFSDTDTLMGLSQKFYGSPSYWWVICLINNVGSEQDITVGQNLVILKPLEIFLERLGI